MIGRQVVFASRPDELPRILAEKSVCRDENRLCGRLIGDRIEGLIAKAFLVRCRAVRASVLQHTNRAIASGVQQLALVFADLVQVGRPG